MPRYILLPYDEPATFADVSPDEMQRILEKYMAWTERLAQEGRLLASDKLVDGSGRRLRKQAGRLQVHDGPYAENREVLGGFWVIRADSYEQAVELAADCPHVEFGTLEVREIEEMER